MSNCTDCILDLTDACPRGSGRAIDDEICDSFISRETYEVNKNESWQLGFMQGKAEMLDEILGLPTEKIMGIEYIRRCDVEELKEKRCNSSGM